MDSENLHKKGEHVFNDIAGSLYNAIGEAAALRGLESLALIGRFGRLDLQKLPRTGAALIPLLEDPVLIGGRSVTAPAHGIENDENSILYGLARIHLSACLRQITEVAADLAWKTHHEHDSSFHRFEEVVTGLQDTQTAVIGAKLAFYRLVDVGVDPGAQGGALSEKTSETELRRRAMLVDRTLRHLPEIKDLGDHVIEVFAEEVRDVLEQRVRQARQA